MTKEQKKNIYTYLTNVYIGTHNPDDSVSIEDYAGWRIKFVFDGDDIRAFNNYMDTSEIDFEHLAKHIADTTTFYACNHPIKGGAQANYAIYAVKHYGGYKLYNLTGDEHRDYVHDASLGTNRIWFYLYNYFGINVNFDIQYLYCR